MSGWSASFISHTLSFSLNCRHLIRPVTTSTGGIIIGHRVGAGPMTHLPNSVAKLYSAQGYDPEVSHFHRSAWSPDQMLTPRALIGLTHRLFNELRAWQTLGRIYSSWQRRTGLRRVPARRPTASRTIIQSNFPCLQQLNGTHFNNITQNLNLYSGYMLPEPCNTVHDIQPRK